MRTIESLTDGMPPQVRSRATFLRVIHGERELDVAEVQRWHRNGATVDDLAGMLNVDVRSVYRYLQDRTPCEGDRCLTMVQGGGLCSFCRRSA